MASHQWGREPETFSEFLIGAGRHYYHAVDNVNSDYRVGQAYYNYLEKWYPDVANGIAGGDTDPFYTNANLSAFLDVVAKFFAANPRGCRR